MLEDCEWCNKHMQLIFLMDLTENKTCDEYNTMLETFVRELQIDMWEQTE